MDTFVLKILACLFMLIDHVSLILLDNNFYGRAVGRLAFPLFAYLVAMNIDRTSNKSKYFIRLIIFAFVSQIPFYFIGNSGLNIFFTLGLGFLACYYWNDGVKKYFNLLCFVLVILLSFFPVDYGVYGVLVVLSFYILKDSLIKQFISLLVLNIAFYKIIPMQVFSIFAFIPIYFYNNKQGFIFKYAFYGFYPVHLFLLLLIKYIH